MRIDLPLFGESGIEHRFEVTPIGDQIESYRIQVRHFDVVPAFTERGHRGSQQRAR